MEAIEFKPTVGKTYRGDFGVIYSDKEGRINQLRMNWSNKNTGLTADVSREVRIYPERWADIEVKK